MYAWENYIICSLFCNKIPYSDHEHRTFDPHLVVAAQKYVSRKFKRNPMLLTK